MTFKEILGSISADAEEKKKKGKELWEKAEELSKKMDEIAKQLDEIYGEIRAIEEEEKEILIKAMQVAEILHLEIPEEYQEKIEKIRQGEERKKQEEEKRKQEELQKKRGERSRGKFLWKPEGRKQFQAEISRAMWRISRGSGGSAGDDGVLTVKEFIDLIGFNPDTLEVGKEVTVTLPNKLKVTFAKSIE